MKLSHYLPLSVVLFGLAWVGTPAFSAEIYVDNRKGDDRLNGVTPDLSAGGIGPVKSIRRALQLAKESDTIVLTNNGIPYRESIALFGPRHSGFANNPFTIIGNGAVLDGSQPVPEGAWQRVGDDLFRLKVFSKGWYQLTLDDQAVPEHKLTPQAKGPEEIPIGQWGVWQGAIYYHAERLTEPSEMNFAFATIPVGISLYRVFYVRIVDLQIRHFRIDGVSAPDLSDAVLIEQVQIRDNGRYGLATAGTSRVHVRDCQIAGNREGTVLIRGLSGVDLAGSDLSEEPTLAD